MSQERLSVLDHRTGKSYEIPIQEGTIRATDLRQIRTGPDDAGILSYDPAFMNTASCRSAITFIDGDRGILRYRGYPVEQLAESASYLEVAHLLIHGELPSPDQLKAWRWEITHHTWIHENLKRFLDGFHHDAHPMAMLVSAVAALSTFYPDARGEAPQARTLQMVRLIAKMPTLAAFAYRHSVGMPYAYPDNDLSYAGNLLNMLFKATEVTYRPDPVLERAVDVLFILHADHEQNCSTNAVRSVGSSRVDPYCAVAAGVAALFGPLHGGANEEVLRMLQAIGTVDRVPDFIRRVKAGEGRLMGFGHRVYKNYDPRARLIKRLADQVFAVTRPSPLLPIALELERIALQEEYFVSRKLYPNVDFYSGLIYQAMGFPTAMFPVLFAIARTSGWLAQWSEMMDDPAQKIARPRQVYIGPGSRDVLPVERRGAPAEA
jgi:citrate synthase